MKTCHCTAFRFSPGTALLGLLVCLMVPVMAQAQTANTGTVLGVVADPSGAIVPGADVELKDLATGDVRTAVTNEIGRFTFVAVKPGTYSITVAAPGFQKSVVEKQVVEVSKSYNLNFTLKIGMSSETVVVTAAAGAELQTTDATVGDTLGGDMLLKLPSLDRNVASFLLLQPSAMPQQAETQSSRYGGQVAGAQSDQNTFVLDGGNVTSGVSGNSDYWTNYQGAPEGAIPTPVESIQEFRVATSNQVASFSSSGGSQVMLVTKRGGDKYHGSAYEYLQNKSLNANTWDRNRLIPFQPRPMTQDNRFGVTLGGPIPKLGGDEKTYFFFNYEGRRRNDYSQITRTVPTSTLRQGILRFKDASGNVISYNLSTSTQCSPSGSLPCDPRGLGLNPVVSQIWNQYMPAGNDPSRGDGLNTIGFTAPGKFPNNDNFAVMRVDRNLTSNWQVMGSFRYFKQVHNGGDRQIDIGGLLPGDKLGVPSSPAFIPRQPRYLVFGLTGRLTPRTVNEFAFSYLRDYWFWQTDGSRPQVPGTDSALNIAGNMNPLDLTVGLVRQREWRAHNWTWSDNFSWVKANHLLQIGGSLRRNAIQFWRDDAQSAVAQRVYLLTAGQGLNIPSIYQPPICSSTVTTNCLPSNQTSNWNNFYAGVLGLTDRATLVATRDANFKINPLGAPLGTDSHYNEYSIYANDSWKVSPTLTLNLGLNWSADVPETEVQGKLALAYYATGEVVIPSDYIAQRAKAALAGTVFNPIVTWKPIGSTDRSYPYDPTWTNFGPRLAVAWNPSFSSGLWGKMFGNRKTVVRAGFARLYDRLNGVQKVIDAQQVLGFTQTLLCLGPSINGQCTGSSGINPLTGFRVKIDGNTIPLPSYVANQPIPVIPGNATVSGANQAFANASTQLAPKFRPAINNSYNLTLQRELGKGTILEIGYIRRDARNLLEGMTLNQVPYMMVYGGQSFAQAYDAVADQVRAGIAAASVAPQPFFETSLAGSSYCKGNPSCTAGVVAKFSSNLRNSNVFDLFNGLQSSFVFGPATAAGTQINDFLYFTDYGKSSYNAGFVSLKMRDHKGLSLNGNFTWAHSLDNGVVNQDIDSYVANSYNTSYGWGNSVFDRKFVFNVMGLYNMPFHAGNPVLHQIVKGWSIAPIFSWYTGLPLRVTVGSGQEFGQGATTTAVGAVLMQPNTFGNSAHQGVTGSAGIGTNANPATGGTGLNLFADPAAVFAAFRPIRLSQDTSSSGYCLRGQNRWNFDMALSRQFKVSERASFALSAQFFNVFNHVLFNDPGLSLQSPTAFGVITSQMNSPRRIELGLHIDF
ncbi:MAG: carboxypeptidase-like regulatory domain-containing protein [Acidobacteriia bacterium]|nr:carboxypeptidase-like regulatory domain-containing protein [Terriglobia bacterium]